jgi:hypothetical protein
MKSANEMKNMNTSKQSAESLESVEDVKGFLIEFGLAEAICVARNNVSRQTVELATYALLKDCCDTYDRYAFGYKEDEVLDLSVDDVERRYWRCEAEKLGHRQQKLTAKDAA